MVLVMVLVMDPAMALVMGPAVALVMDLAVVLVMDLAMGYNLVVHVQLTTTNLLELFHVQKVLYELKAVAMATIVSLDLKSTFPIVVITLSKII